MVSNCSNNYGPYHFPEKLIPLIILNALEGKPLPVYGKGENVRDWLYVEDHARALDLIAERGRLGETYNVGGRNERRNIDVVRRICAILDRACARGQSPARRLITFVTDRPGHDPRYAIDATKLETRARLARAGDFRQRHREDRALVSRQRMVVAAAARALCRRAARACSKAAEG